MTWSRRRYVRAGFEGERFCPPVQTRSALVGEDGGPRPEIVVAARGRSIRGRTSGDYRCVIRRSRRRCSLPAFVCFVAGVFVVVVSFVAGLFVRLVALDGGDF